MPEILRRMEEIMSEKSLAQHARAEPAQAALLPLLKRLHFYIGLFIAPFIFIAALTGALYVLSPQLENILYKEALFTDASGDAKPLADQIRVAEKQLGAEAQLFAIRPAPAAGETTRVMFITPDSGPSESTAVFVDPATLEVRGVYDVYGTSGVLPFRTWLDYLHRNLLLGDIGRNYSELAASWLWIAALGGLILWATQRTVRSSRRATPTRGQRILRQRYWHSTLGLVLIIGLIFFSATGLTWSRWAGDNISAMRAHFGWMTPSVNTSLTPQDSAMAAMPMDEHAEHKGHGMAMAHSHKPGSPITPEQFDSVLHAARMAGISANKVEIRPSRQDDKAWTVNEIDRSWPTQVDSVAVNPHTFAVMDKVEFAQYGLLAKLTRWGVDAHMGVLFGLPNQLLLAAFAFGLCIMIVLGYRLWWLRRPAAGQGPHPADTLRYHWQKLSLSGRFLMTVCTVLFALSLPVMGISLVILLVIDAFRWQQAHKTQA